MGKARLSVTVDESVKKQLDAREDINTSGLVNDLLRRYLRGESKDKATKRQQIERLKQEAREKQTEANSLMQQADTLKEELEQMDEQQTEAWREAVKTLTPKLQNNLSSSPRDWFDPDPDDIAVQTQAEKVGVPVHEFCERFHDKRRKLGIGETTERGVE